MKNIHLMLFPIVAIILFFTVAMIIGAWSVGESTEVIFLILSGICPLGLFCLQFNPVTVGDITTQKQLNYARVHFIFACLTILFLGLVPKNRSENMKLMEVQALWGCKSAVLCNLYEHTRQFHAGAC